MVSKLFTGTLVCFDISNNRNRTKLCEDLKDLGLERIQESVFYGLLSRPEVKQIKNLLKKYCDIKESTDRAFFLQGVDPLSLEKSSVGYSKDDFNPPEVSIL